MKKYMLLLGLMFLVASCAGMKPQRPSGFESYHTVVLDMIPDVAVDVEQVQMLQNMLVEALEERQVFRSVRTDPDESADDSVIIQVRITRFRTETDLHRMMWGSMAGSNEIAADIAAMDAKTRQVLSSFSLMGESPDYPPSFDWPWGSMGEAMQRLTRKLVNVLLDWKQASNLEN